MKFLLKQCARSLGYKVVRLGVRNDIWSLLETLLKEHDINVLIDIGANEGQFLQKLLDSCRHHFDRHLSFEPLPDAYAILYNKSFNLPKRINVETFNIALGDVTGHASMNVMPNSVSSSLLEPTGDFIGYMAGDKAALQRITVPVYRFDEFCLSLQPSLQPREGMNSGDSCFLKLDVQGFELHILEGFGEYLDIANVVLLECSLIKTYSGGPLINDMLNFMATKGYYVAGIFPGFFDDRRQQLYEVDVVFSRERGDG